MGEPIVTVYVPTFCPAFSEMVKSPLALFRVTVSGDAEVSEVLDSEVFDPTPKVHDPPETETGVVALGSAPPLLVSVTAVEGLVE